MIFAFAEREEAQDLLACLSSLVLCVAALHSELPVEFDAFKSREIVSLNVLRFQLESFGRFLEVKFPRCGVDIECVDKVKDDITTENFS